MAPLRPKWPFYVIALLIVASLTAVGARADALQLGEYDVKAAFLLNFARYVEWPPEAFQGATQALTICVAGQDPFGSALDDIVAGKTIGGREIVVRRLPGARTTEQ